MLEAHEPFSHVLVYTREALFWAINSHTSSDKIHMQERKKRFHRTGRGGIRQHMSMAPT